MPIGDLVLRSVHLLDHERAAGRLLALMSAPAADIACYGPVKN